MNKVVLTLLDFLGDVDKIRLLSTCTEFWELRFRITLTGRYDYNMIAGASYVNSFTNVYLNVTESQPIHPCVRKVYIDKKCKNVCTIPHTVDRLEIIDFYLPINIQDGDNIITRTYGGLGCTIENIPRNYGNYGNLVVKYTPGFQVLAENFRFLRIMGGSAVLRYNN